MLVRPVGDAQGGRHESDPAEQLARSRTIARKSGLVFQKRTLHFEHETVLDGRKFDRPVNYALLRIAWSRAATSRRSGARRSGSGTTLSRLELRKS